MLNPRPDLIETFVGALFRYAEPDTFVSLRAFDQTARNVPPVLIEAVKIGDGRVLIDRASRAARIAANAPRPAVFAPPVATFNNPDTARSADLANGVALSVEIDAGDPARALKVLSHLMGPPTIVVFSGGEWADPETGEIHRKQHLHWRLSEPTATPDDHQRLQDARWLAAVLVGADRSAAPPAHPLRWPGSWNIKSTPRLATIATCNPDSEIHLDYALERLQDAVEAAGLRPQGKTADRTSGAPHAADTDIADALPHVPNPDVDWEHWNRIGMAAWAATRGSEGGLRAWCEWSAKSQKHDEAACIERWAHFATSPPSRIGAGTIFYLARQNGWARDQEAPPADAYEEDARAEAGRDEDAPADDHHTQADMPQEAPRPPAGLRTFADLDLDAPISPRQWLLGTAICGGYMTVLVAAGGVGKTTLATAWALAIASGKALTKQHVHHRRPVLYLALEDDDDELRRRVTAAMRQHRIARDDLDGMFFWRAEPAGLLLVKDTERGMVATPLLDSIFDEMDELGIAAIFIDPYVRSNDGEENDNKQQAAVIGHIAQRATAKGIAVVGLHHVRKGSAEAGDADSARGASAIIAHARLAFTLLPMAEKEATEFGIQIRDRREYVRLDPAKANITRAAADATWFRLHSVALGNATADYPHGDHVQAIAPWTPRAVWQDIDNVTANRILDAIAQGPAPGCLYTATRSGADHSRWAGNCVMNAIACNPDQAARVIQTWTQNQVLVEVEYRDPVQRKTRMGVRVNDAKRPS